MKKLKNLLGILPVLIILAVLLSTPVLANSPPPADRLTVAISNLPEGAVYAELLIKIGEDDPNYVDFQSNALSCNPQSVKEILDYESEGFRSFTLHYKDAQSYVRLKGYDSESYYCVDFGGGTDYNSYLTQYEDLRKNYRDFKIALLDKDFNIIHVSELSQLPELNSAITFSGFVYYDVSQNSIEAQTWVNSYFIVFGGIFALFFMSLSVGTEIVGALLFGFRGKHIKTVFVVNVCSQIIMRVLYILSPFAYLFETIVLEAFVYCTEFFVYRKSFKEIGTARIVAYTVIANTLSLFVGIILDCYVLS